MANEHIERVKRPAVHTWPVGIEYIGYSDQGVSQPPADWVASYRREVVGGMAWWVRWALLGLGAGCVCTVHHYLTTPNRRRFVGHAR